MPANHIRVGARTIGEGSPTYVVAEMACAHEGSPELAHRLVDIAANAGADAVQLQLISAKSLITPSHANYPNALRLEIPMSQWLEIMAHVRQRGLQVWANVFDEGALAVAMRADVAVIKLHSSDLANPRMLDAVASTSKPVSLAVGGSTIDEISQAVFRLRTRSATSLILMHGYQGYPTMIHDCHLRFIESLKRLFNCVVGYQDHTDGASELAVTLPLVAIVLGACVLEKHYTDDRSRNGTDYEAALGPVEFARFVEMARGIDAALGDGAIQPLSDAELTYRRTMKKTIVAARSIRKGEVFTEDMLSFMRGEPGLAPSEASRMIGMRSRKDIPQFATISLTDLYLDEETDCRSQGESG